MHRRFRGLLADAKGYSELIVAVFVDVRGFSSFSRRVDSREVGLYATKLYLRLIDDYFPDADFWKSTGDGLLIVVKIDDESQSLTRAQAIIQTCFRLLEQAPSLFEGDFLINFTPPTTLGIGIARGSACRIATPEPEGETLDYSGHVLNLAARLMDMARPSGIVIDGAYGVHMMSEEVKSRFAPERVYVRGVSPSAAVDIYYSKGMTIITPDRKRPLDHPETATVTFTTTLGYIAKLPGPFSMVVARELQDVSEVSCRLEYPRSEPSGRRARHGATVYCACDCVSKLDVYRGRHSVVLDTSKVKALLQKVGVKAKWPVTIQLSYPEK